MKPEMNERNIILAGIGGQGIVFLTRLISYTAVNLGYVVVVSETHGMSQRGGSVVSHLKINGNAAPLIQRGAADLMIAMDPHEAMQNLDFMRRGGMVFVNSKEGLAPILTPHLERLNIVVVNFSATHIAIGLGVPSAANVVMAGFIFAHDALNLPFENITETIKQISSKAVERNLQALEAGFQAGKKKVDETQVTLENPR